MNYKGYRIHKAGIKRVVVFANTEWQFDTIASAKRFITDITGK